MTTAEKDEIIELVIQSLRTNSRTIGQLTPVTSLGSTDYIEVSGGRYVDFITLANLIIAIANESDADLMTLISHNVLSSISFNATATNLSMSVSQVGKTITASIPIATDSKSGILKASDYSKISLAYDRATLANDKADSINNKIGQAGGIAPLDSSGKVPANNLPISESKKVVHFAGTTNIPMGEDSSSPNEQDGSSIYFNLETNKFVCKVGDRYLSNWINKDAWGVSSSGGVTPQTDRLYYCKGNGLLYRWDGGTLVNITYLLGDTEGTAYPGATGKANAELLAQVDFKLRTTEAGLNSLANDLCGEIEKGVAKPWQSGVTQPKNTLVTHNGTLYQVANPDGTSTEPTSDNADYRMLSAAIVQGTGESETAVMSQKAVSEKLKESNTSLLSLGILTVDGKWDRVGGALPRKGVYLCSNGNGGFYFRSFGDTRYYGFGEDAYNDTTDNTYLKNRIYMLNGELVRINEDGDFESVCGGGTASPIGNCYNVTNERVNAHEPNGSGISETYYDTFQSAVAYTYSKGKIALGMQLTYAAADHTWETWQFVGGDLEEATFKSSSNWIDMASLSKGEEVFINVNRLCNHPAYYSSLALALADLISLESSTGTTYRKAGLIIHYRVKDQQWETKKFTGDPESEFQTIALWQDFGGSGDAPQVQTSDEPEAGGEDAFSTGGAAQLIPVDRSVRREGFTTTITLYNSLGEPIFDPIEVISSGGGEASGSSIGITAKDAAVYAAYGMPMVAKFAVRSETVTGGTTLANAIEKIEIIDRDTNQTVYSWSGSVDSSDSLDKADEDWNFEIDLQSIFSSASVKRLRIEATDELGKTATKAFQAVAEDLTVTCKHKLDYNSGNNVDPSADSVTLDFYQFESTTSAVRAYVDILIGDEWVNVHEKLLADNTKNYGKSITFSPSELGLSHGSYLMRVYGVSENSGVKGNTIYTTLFCVDPESNDSLVGISYNDTNNGEIRNYDTALVKVAAYKKSAPLGLDVAVAMGNDSITTVKLLSNQTEPVECRVLGYEDNTTIAIRAHVGSVFSPFINLVVIGSAVDVALKGNAAFNFSFRNRSNSETDHTITHNGTTLTLNGANYTTNGFVDYLGERCLRIAEGVTASMNYAPFGLSSVESNGTALQLRFATDNVEDPDAILMDCYNPAQGAGFFIKGNTIGFGVLGGTRSLETRRFDSKKFHTVLFVAEPGSIYEERNNTKYGRYYAYFDGEKIGRVGYLPEQTPSALYCTKQITMDSTHGDLYITDMTGWRSYIEWSEAMGSYLSILSNVDAMKREYDFEDVLRVQSAEEIQMMRPQIQELLARGIPCTVYVGSKEYFERFDSGTDTSEKFYFDIYHYDPIPWRSYIAYHVEVRRQGTTSAKRCKKNTREYYIKATSIVPMYPSYADDHALTAEQLADLDITYSLYELKYVRVGENTIPVQIVTNKVDFSNSSGANDSGTCNMMNATFRSLAKTDPMYLTPAQRAFDGTWSKGGVSLTGLEMNHSTANAPVALFRSIDNMQSCYFEAKANYKEDKGEQVALGFINTPGYNLGCKNWQSGDFVAVWGNPGETLDQIESRFRNMSGLDTDQLYLLKPYCSRNYRFMRYKNGAWAMSPGSMKQVAGKWVVSGDVLNPVDGVEMLTYTGMNWCQGVGSLEDMMGGTTNYSSWVQKLISKGKLTEGAQVPAWTTYFESMVDSDDLALAFAQGKTVPFELYKFMRFCDAADYATKADWKAVWHDSAYKYLSVRSNYVTRAAEDYNHMSDSVSKNKQPMFHLEEGHSVVNGVYDPEIEGAADEDGFNYVFNIEDDQQPIICYLNKIYDIDGANEDDNDGGGNADPEEDPDKPSDTESGYQNSWAGWGSVLFKSCVMQDTALVDAEGTEMSYRSTVAAMRSCQTTLADGTIIKPFSPEGAIYYYITDRAERWPKNVSSFDGWRKYESYTSSADSIYFYALRGLGLASTPQFVKTRWRFRDGFYKTGDFFAQDGTISGRVSGAADATIRIKAAKAGYFGIGNDSSGAVSERVYLEAGETYEFTEFRKDNGALLYIYQADRMEEIDLSDLTLSIGFNFSNARLAKKIILGGEGHVNLPMAYDVLSSLPLGSLPFLETLDIRGTQISGVNAEGCPRLRHFYADNSLLTTLTIAETSPINDISLPDTMTEIKFVGLPALTYSRLQHLSGLRIAGMPAVNTLRLERVPNINGCMILADLLEAQSESLALRNVRLTGVILRGSGSELLSLINARWTDPSDGSIGSVGGIGETGATDRPVINGTYLLERIIEQSEVEAIEEGIQGITIEIVVEAYVDRIDEVNAETYSGESEVEDITLDNIGEHLDYYNGETYEQYVARIAAESTSVHDLILQD